MKTSIRFTLYILLIGALDFQGFSQCTIINRLSYDTTVNGTGTQDPPYDFTFPKFDGVMGTLTNVNVASVISVTYSVSIENPNPTAKSARFRLIRTDDISSSALMSPLFSSASSPSPTTYHGPYPLAASNGVPNSGPDYVAVGPLNVFTNDTIINQDLSNTADYLGAGSVNFQYSSSLGALVVPTGQGLTPISSANDNIKFIVTYTYCNNITLATDITSFTASKQNDIINLRWFTDNERSERSYELLKSYDGKTFTSVKKFDAIVNANQSGAYQYNYVPLSSDKGKIIFRLKQTEKDGKEKYSALRVVDLGNDIKKTGIRLLPNPSNGNVVIVLNNSIRSDWQVDIFSLNGQLIQRKEAINSLAIKLDTRDALKPGIYMVKATNKKTLESFVERMVIQ